MLRLFAFGSGVRRAARWLLLPALVLWPLHLVLFGTEFGQFAAFAAAFFLGLLAVVLGVLGLGIEWFASSHPEAPAVPLRPLVRDLGLAALAMVVWFSVMASDANAHLWLWWHRATLERVVERAAHEPTAGERPIDGYTVRTHDGSVLVVLRGVMRRYGVAWDPDRRLQPGTIAEMYVNRVHDLHGGFRAWFEDD